LIVVVVFPKGFQPHAFGVRKCFLGVSVFFDCLVIMVILCAVEVSEAHDVVDGDSITCVFVFVDSPSAIFTAMQPYFPI